MMKKEKSRKGVTLIELIVAMAIVAIIIASSSAAIVMGLKTYNRNFSTTIGQQNLRQAMMKITKNVRNNASTVSITGTNVLTVGGKNYTVSSGSLTYNGQSLAQSMTSIAANYTDSSHTIVQVDLTSSDGNTLSTQISLS
jgi:prepilin-type N-terminal cleavage/methylation domain-containing protein